jgi:hypothetical protein
MRPASATASFRIFGSARRLLGVTPLPALRPILIAHEPIDGAKREDRRSKREQLLCLGMTYVEDEQQTQ